VTKFGNIRLRDRLTRVGLALVVSYAFLLGMSALWVVLAREHDWVLEYRYWLTYGTRAGAVAIFAGCLVQRWTKPLVRKGESRGA
jgi:hypothetical protein